MAEVRIKLSTDGAAAVSSDFRAVAREVNALGDRIDKAFKPQLTATEAAFRTLGLEGSRAFKELQQAAQADAIKAAFDTIQKSSFAAGTEVDRAAKAMNARLAELESGTSRLAQVGGAGFSSFRQSAARALEIFVGFSLAGAAAQVGSFVQRSVGELTRMGLENQRVEESFSRMAQAVGADANALVVSLKAASAGIVDTNSIMLASSKALAQGLNGEQLTRIMETARAQATLAGTTVSDAFNQIAESVTNLQVKQLRAFGIVIDQQKAYEDYARSLGTVAGALNEVGQRAAILAAIDAQTLQRRQALTEGERTSAQEIEKAQAKWGDFWAMQAKGLADAYTGFVRGGAAFLEWAEKQTTWLDRLAEKWERYKASAFWGKGTAFPDAQAALMPSRDALAKAASQDDWMLGLGPASNPAAGVDKVKDAMLKADVALRMLTASYQAGVVTSAQYEAGLVSQIARLQALGTALDDEGRIKVLGLQVALNAIRVPEWLSTMKKLADDASEALGEAGLLLEIKGVLADMDALSFTLGENRDAVQRDTDAWREEQEAIRLAGEAMATIPALAEAIQASLDGSALTDDLIAVNRELRALQAATDLDAESIRKFGVAFRLLTENQAEWIVSSRAVRQIGADKTFADALAAINAQAAVLGPSFDRVGQEIRITQQELARLAKDSQDVVTPAIADLQARLNGLMGEQFVEQLRDAFGLTRTIFDDLIDAARGTASAMYGGFSDFFFTLFTGQIEKLSDVFRNFGLSMLRVLSDFLASAVVRQLLGFFSDLIGGFSGGSSGGFFGAIASGLGSLLGGNGGGSSGGSVFGTIATWVGGAFTKIFGGELLAAGKQFFVDLFGQATIGQAAAAASLSDYLRSAVDPLVAWADNLSTSFTGLTAQMATTTSWLDRLGAAALPIIGLGTSIFSLVNSIQSGNGLGIGLGVAGTGLSAYGVASSLGLVPSLSTVLIDAFKAAAPQAAAYMTQAIGNAIGPVLTSSAPQLPQAIASLGYLINPAAIFAVMFSIGNMMDSMEDAAQAVRDAKRWAAEASAAMSAITAVTDLFEEAGEAFSTANLADTLSKVQYALRSLPDLIHASFFGAEGITAALPELRAKVGTVLLAALDAGQRAGLDIASVTASPVQFRTSGIGYNVAGNAMDFSKPINLAYLRDAFDAAGANYFQHTGLDVLGGEIADMASLLRHLIEANDDASRGLAGAWAAHIDERNPMPFGPDDMNELFRQVMTPERIASIASHGEIGDIGNFLIDTAKLNARLNQEFLTISLRNAVVDIAQSLGLGEGAVGLGSGAEWRLAHSVNDDGTMNWDTLPSAADIAAVAQRLQEAGFAAGNYGEALKAYLLSIDANLVNNPAWAGIVAALEGQGGASVAAMQQAASQAAVAAAQALVDRLRGELDAAIAATDWGLAAQLTAAWQQAQQALAAAQGAAAAAAEALKPRSPSDYYEAAKAITDSLTAQIKHQLEVRAGTTDENTLQNIDAVIERMTAQVRALSGSVQLYAVLPVEIANLTGSLADRTAAAIEAFRVQRRTLEDTLTAARTAADEALATGDIVAVQAAEQQLHDAVMARYQFEMKAITDILATIAGYYERLVKPVDTTLTQLAVADLARGSAAAFNELYLRLADMAMVAPTVAQRLYAISQGLALIVAGIPTSAGFFANGSSIYSGTPGASGAPQTVADAIAHQIAANAAPFLAVLNDLLAEARGSGDLEATLSLLQQQAEAIKAIGVAAVQAVNEWARAASEQARSDAAAMVADINQNWDALETASRASAEAQRADINRNWDAAAQAVNDAADLAIAGKQAEITAIEAATKARQAQIAAETKVIQAQQAALQEQIQATREWESFVSAVDDQIRGIRLGGSSTLNPADQLALAQRTLDSAFAAFQAAPSAALGGDVQRAVTDLLAAGQNVFTRPSPEFQALEADALAILDALKATGLAEAGPVSSTDLEAQTQVLAAELQRLQDESATLNETSAQQVELLRAGIAALEEGRRADLAVIEAGRKRDLELVDQWLTAQLEYIAAGREYDLGLVNVWLTAQLAAIESARATTVGNIEAAMAAALRANAAEQLSITDKLVGAQLQQLNAITEGKPVQTFMAEQARKAAELLGVIALDLHTFITSFQPHAEGVWNVGATHPAIVHAGEMIVPRTPAELLRRSAGFVVAPPAPATRGGTTFAPTINVTVHGADDPAKARAFSRQGTLEALREYEQTRRFRERAGS